MTKRYIFSKEIVLPEWAVKQFSNEFLDDVDAFNESVDEDALRAIMPNLRALTQWRPAKSIIKLRDQINTAFPNRHKLSDGVIGDSNHCPGSSDHCPNIIDQGIGVVTAIDITHDPTNDCDMHDVTRMISDDKDSRIKYIIYNSQICSSYPYNGVPAWAWRPYTGQNPHRRHAHFSVLSQKSKYDDVSNWTIS